MKPFDKEHEGCGDGWVMCMNPTVTHPHEIWRMRNSKLSVADNDKDGKLGGTQFRIELTGTREQLEKWGPEEIEKWVSYLKGQLLDNTKERV